MKRIKQKKNTADKVKKAYQRPELTIFGSITQITENLTAGPQNDTGKGKGSMSS